MPERNFKDAVIARFADELVFRALRNENGLHGCRTLHFAFNVDARARIKRYPQLTPMVMILITHLLASTDFQNLDGDGLVEDILDKAAPRFLCFLIVTQGEAGFARFAGFAGFALRYPKTTLFCLNNDYK